MQIRFDKFVLDTDRRQLTRDGTEIVLSPKAYHLLTVLVDARPNAQSKDVLYQALWPNTFVVEANLSNLVGEIRSALGESAHQARYIRTLHGFGYAFCAEAASIEPMSEPGSAPRGYLTVAGGQAFALRLGENVVGRGSEAQVRIDLPGISRRHARIVISDTSILIEDLDSKNGTFVGDTRVTSPVALEPGAVLSFGAIQAVFHSDRTDSSTETVRT
jgi:DNA-binding winged helix-turn-helix (wHTH) protein